jgi:hypothetical protein
MYWLRAQLWRAAKLCVVSRRVPRDADVPIALGQPGSHPLECHFVLVLAVKCGGDRWTRWLCTELHAAPTAEFNLDPDQHEHRLRLAPTKLRHEGTACDEQLSNPGPYVGCGGTLGKCVPTALLWMARLYASIGFEQYVGDLFAALDNAGDRAIQAKQGAGGRAHSIQQQQQDRRQSSLKISGFREIGSRSNARSVPDRQQSKALQPISEIRIASTRRSGRQLVERLKPNPARTPLKRPHGTAKCRCPERDGTGPPFSRRNSALAL